MVRFRAVFPVLVLVLGLTLLTAGRAGGREGRRERREEAGREEGWLSLRSEVRVRLGLNILKIPNQP